MSILQVIERSYRAYETEIVAIHESFEPQCTALFTKHVYALAAPLGMVPYYDEEKETSGEEVSGGEQQSTSEEEPDAWADIDGEFSFGLKEKTRVQTIRSNLMALPEEDGQGNADEEVLEGATGRDEDGRMTIPRGADGIHSINKLFIKSMHIIDLNQ